MTSRLLCAVALLALPGCLEDATPGSAEDAVDSKAIEDSDAGEVVNADTDTGADTAAEADTEASPDTGAPACPRATTRVDLWLGLDRDAPYSHHSFNLDDPEASSVFWTAFPVYDTAGAPHEVRVYFALQVGDPNSWEHYAVVDGGELAEEHTGQAIVISDGVIEFSDEDGRLIDQDNNPFDLQFRGQTDHQEIAFWFGDETGGSTLRPGPSTVDWLHQDGCPPGGRAP